MLSRRSRIPWIYCSTKIPGDCEITYPHRQRTIICRQSYQLDERHQARHSMTCPQKSFDKFQSFTAGNCIGRPSKASVMVGWGFT